MKTLVKKLLTAAGFSVTRLGSRVEIDSAWGPNILDYALKELAARTDRPLKIVQVGAHDGSDHDPLQQFLLDNECRALLIEPMDAPFAVLAARYAGVDAITTTQIAIHDSPATLDMHYIVNGDGAPDLTLFSSFDHATVAHNLMVRQREDDALKDHHILSKPIKADRLKSVMDASGFQQVDAIVVDAEGLDYKIVTSFLADGVLPDIIRFEYCNLSRRDFNDLRQVLSAHGYEIVRAGVDIYCQKEGLLR
ncbi:FkbM family methyltransferase [Shimia sp.]|uniref:FkbM family methyltransferase n=1 Tax=Shimia sp. TaxID=1954381 RepID=UPI00329877FC